MKYHLITYGCQMNTADSEEMARPLEGRGLMATSRPEEADVIVMNTCTVREQAEHRADSNIGRLRAWKAQDPHRILIVAGCAASRWGDSILRKYPFIDLVSPATKIEEFPQAVEQVLKERWNWDAETRFAAPPSSNILGKLDPSSQPPNNLDFVSKLGHRSKDASDRRSPSRGEGEGVIGESGAIFGDERTAYVTIMRGCNYSCSYCIVPQVRGREVYRPMPQILEEVRRKAVLGFREVMLLGQTVNSYYYRSPHPDPLPRSAGEGEKIQDFADLLREVDSVEGIERIRFMSPHPRHMRDAVIEAMRECGKVARHLHLPVQSGSSRMLERMKRLYSRDEYIGIVKKLRAAIPEISITTDIIVGFPGETPEDFEETLSLLSEIRFNGLFAFKYSPRPGTASAPWADDVADELKERRLQQVLALNTNIKAAVSQFSVLGSGAF